MVTIPTIPFKAAALSSSFMLTSILGFIISFMWVYPQSKKFGFAFALIFFIMFIAAVISMTKAPIEEEYLADLAIHEPTKHARRHRIKK